MSSVTNSISIPRSIDDVFSVMTDVEMTGRWFPGDVEERWTSPPPHGVRSTRHAVVRMFGVRSENEAVVTEYQPPRRAVMEGTSPNAPFVVSLDLTARGNSTLVTVTSEIRLRGAARLFGPIVAAIYGRAWARGLRNLKGLMETGAL
jgi:uncharacterized protein YndB with AHSA1/START domain